MQKMTDEFTQNRQLLSESSRIINLEHQDNVIIRKSKAIHNEKIEHLVIIRNISICNPVSLVLKSVFDLSSNEMYLLLKY